IDAKQGLTCTNPSEAEVLRKLVQHSKMKVVVADHSKLGSVSRYLLCPTKGIDRLITDTGASASAIAPFEKLGIEITLVYVQSTDLSKRCLIDLRVCQRTFAPLKLIRVSLMNDS